MNFPSWKGLADIFMDLFKTISIFIRVPETFSSVFISVRKWYKELLGRSEAADLSLGVFHHWGRLSLLSNVWLWFASTNKHTCIHACIHRHIRTYMPGYTHITTTHVQILNISTSPRRLPHPFSSLKGPLPPSAPMYTYIYTRRGNPIFSLLSPYIRFPCCTGWKWNYVECIFGSLTSFTKHSFEIHPWSFSVIICLLFIFIAL